MSDELKGIYDRTKDNGGAQNEDVVEDSGRTTGLDMKQIVPAPIARVADQAVEMLDVKEFIKTHLDTIYMKLEECDRYAQSAHVNGDMMFIALSLPIINGVIHIASNRRDLNKASRWVVNEWKDEDNKDPDPVSILSALTLIYVVAKGWAKFQDDPEKQEIWSRIVSRVRKLSSETI